MELKRAYKYRIYPTKPQRIMLAEWEAQLRWLWNLANEQRVSFAKRTRADRAKAFEQGIKPPDYFSQSKEMTSLVAEDARLAAVPSCVRQEILRDLEKAWQRFRKGLGGKPHFKRRNDAMRAYAPDKTGWSLTMPDGRFGSIRFRGIGNVQARIDRPLEGVASSCILVRDVGRSVNEHEWYAIILCTSTIHDPAPSKLPPVAINRGVHVLAATSEGILHENPRFYEKKMDLLARRQRQAARKAPLPGQPASKNYLKALHRVARLHQKTRRQRAHVIECLSKQLVEHHGLVAIEAYDTKGMLEKKIEDKPAFVSRAVHRGIADSAWGMLGIKITNKSVPLGVRVEKFSPVDKSRKCNKCGHVDEASMRGREFRCTKCGHEDHIDVNHAKNGLEDALAAANSPPAAPKTRKKTSIPGRRKASATSGPLPDADSGG